MNIETLRKHLDDVDSSIGRLLTTREAIARAIATRKRSAHEPPRDPAREGEQDRRWEASYTPFVASLLRAIRDSTREEVVTPLVGSPRSPEGPKSTPES